MSANIGEKVYCFYKAEQKSQITYFFVRYLQMCQEKRVFFYAFPCLVIKLYLSAIIPRCSILSLLVPLPLVGVSSPVSILNDVVFPAPLIPSRPKHSPCLTPKLRPCTACNLEQGGFRNKLGVSYILSGKHLYFTAFYRL